MEKILEQRAEQVDIMLGILEKYYKIIGKSIAGTNPQKAKEYENGLEILRANKVAKYQFISFEFDKMLDEFMDLFEKYKKTDAALETLGEIINDEEYSKIPFMGLSGSYFADLDNTRLRFNTNLQNYKKEVHENEPKMFEMVDYRLQIGENRSNFIAMLEKLPINKLTIYLIGVLMEKLTEAEKTAVLGLLQNETNKIFGLGEKSRANVDNFSTPQNLVTRYGLYPKTISLSLAEVVEIINITDNVSISHDDEKPLDMQLRAISHGTNAGVILINKKSANPIEFDLRGLISLEYVNKENLVTNQQNGLNKKVITRFNTARILDRANGKISEKIISHISPAHIYVYVLESMDGATFRIMSNSSVSNKLCCKYETVKGIVDGLSLRPMKYNAIIEKNLFEKGISSRAQNMIISYKDYKNEAPPSHIIKTKITNDILRLIDRELETDIPKSQREFRRFIDERAERLAGLAIHKLSAEIGPGKTTQEAKISYLSKFDVIMRDLMKSFEERTNEATPAPIIFRERTVTELRAYLSSIYADIIKKAMDDLDKTGQWTDYDISLKEFI